ncbi:MAG: ASCH domain-containing protein [DPANN group archaeon]|nr:ASCH domain-containing protein [DPANN group archaeon]
MKALSLKQPWAELILQGKKKIETRKWKTNFRGKFYIHASKNIDLIPAKEFGLKDFQTGALIGKAELVDVKEYKDEKDFHKDDDKHLARGLGFRKYGFILKNVKRIKPIPYKGQLNFFEVK